ncbi:alpha/beta fold hydrolase [Marinobacter salexigens]|uniref:alpha/beta fold hydrolase n=1 Tax=Marinobacter salexigens TaxID=1925763 RepID=UPI000C294A5E|nr:alpha/beta hydrolase [Marinobacter salexigens]
MNNEALLSDAQQDMAGVQEVVWPLQHITLAGLNWPAADISEAGSPPIIMLHGWLDNSLTFSRIAPDLARLSSLYAVDMAGHGHSGHRPPGQSYQLMDYVADLAELIEVHFSGVEKVDIVGHSLGGIVGALYAAAFPERIHKLVMIDSLGALSQSAGETIPQLRKSIKKRIAGSGRPAVYPDIVAAAKVREGGFSPLSHEAALALSSRNLRAEGEGYAWRTDARLRHPSPLLMTEEQVVASLGLVMAPALFVRAREGLLAKRKGLDNRAAAIPDLQTVDVPGGHHCHLDGDTRPVADAVRHFLEKE